MAVGSACRQNDGTTTTTCHRDDAETLAFAD